MGSVESSIPTDSGNIRCASGAGRLVVWRVGYAPEPCGPDEGPLAGVRFESRHGDDLRLRAVFERPEDGDVSGWLGNCIASAIDDHDPELIEAMRIQRLSWDT